MLLRYPSFPFIFTSVAFIGALSLSAPAFSQTYAIGDPMIVDCPEGLKGEMTIIETNIKKYPWQIQRWTCEGLSGLVSKLSLEEYLLENPPDKSTSRRWQEKCPSGSIGSIIFNSHSDRRFVESWSCSLDGSTTMSFPDLKKMLETKNYTEGVTGVAQRRNCPFPYVGSYSVVFKDKSWVLQDWTCAAPGSKTKISEATMKILVP